MYITRVVIKNYASLKNVEFEGQPFLVLIGPNGQGKSLILEALYRFFNEFNPIGGGVSIGINDYLWYRRETSTPIEFEVVLKLNESEVEQLFPFEDKFIRIIKEKLKDEWTQLTIKRALFIQGTWKTVEISWAGIPLVTNDVIITPEKLFESLKSLAQFSDYKMYFFTQGHSKDNIGGDRVVIKLSEKRGFMSNTLIDNLVRIGIIESSTEFVGKNLQDWARENGYNVTEPTEADLAELLIVTPETLQRVITSLTNLRGKFKLLSAARDMKAVPGQRTSFLEPTLLQTITNVSIDRSPQAEKKWEQYRKYVESLLDKRVEPHPSQVLLKEGDFGLVPAQIGGGEQAIMGLIWETMDANLMIAIEEPENHLHPALQRELLDYFLKLSDKTQVMLCTHSAIFASKQDIAGVYLVSRDEEGATHVQQLNELNLGRVIEELGIRASDIFDYDTIVFVEGDNDVKIFNALARQVFRGVDVTVGFIDAQGWNSMAYYANARVLKSRRINVNVFVIFDGDIERDERRKKIKERLVKELNLKEDNIVTLKKSSIEEYLLIPAAIKRAFPQIRLTEQEIEACIKASEAKRNKKEVLDLILKRGGIGSYDGEKGVQIVQAMRENEIDNELKDILNMLKQGKK